MRLFSVLFFVLFFLSDYAFEQVIFNNKKDGLNRFNDTLVVEKVGFSGKTIVPVFLIVGAISCNQKQIKEIFQREIRKPFNNFNTNFDDYSPFIPVIQLYSFDLFKFKSKNSDWKQTKNLVVSQLISSFIILGMKNIISSERPDFSNYKSFPSGHTGVAFVSSQVLYNEFIETNKAIAYSGFVSSILTGGLRIINNKHWVPDVLMGAGIGILTSNLVDHYDLFGKWKPFNKNQERKNYKEVKKSRF